MLVYSKILNSYSNHFIIEHFRNKSYFWNYKFFFEILSIKQYLILIKSLIIRSTKIAFVQLEGLGHHWYYRRPNYLADINFSFCKGKKNIYWTQLFDDVACNRSVDKVNNYKTKSTSKLIPKVCFVSSNYPKIANLQKNYPDFYKELDIYGEFHKPIGNKLDLTPLRHINSMQITSKYMAALFIENNEEEGYAQGSALWALECKTPPILKAQYSIKNYIRPEFYINFYDYIKMTNQQRLAAISKVQEYLFLGETYLTNLSLDYINFFKESFSDNYEPDLKKIILKSQSFRSKFITL